MFYYDTSSKINLYYAYPFVAKFNKQNILFNAIFFLYLISLFKPLFYIQSFFLMQSFFFI